MTVLVIDFDDEASTAALDALGARLHPTIVLIDPEGEPVETLLGRQFEEQLRSRVSELVRGAGAEP